MFIKSEIYDYEYNIIVFRENPFHNNFTKTFKEIMCPSLKDLNWEVCLETSTKSWGAGCFMGGMGMRITAPYHEAELYILYINYTKWLFCFEKEKIGIYINF